MPPQATVSIPAYFTAYCVSVLPKATANATARLHWILEQSECILSAAMRFTSKFDRWLVIVLILSACVTCVILPAIAFFGPVPRTGIPWFALTPVVIWAVMLLATLPQYYEVREDGLFLRQGWRRALIPYPSLTELQSMTDSRSGGVFSADRILLVTREGKRFLIAPAEQKRFLDEVARKTPDLERKNFGLALPFSSPTII